MYSTVITFSQIRIIAELLLLFGIICFLLIALCNTQNVSWKKAPIFHQDIATCNSLLASTTLKKRAGPNKRLKVAFGIDNAFTTTDEVYYKAFRQNIERRLHNSNKAKHRRDLRDEGLRTIQAFLDTPRNQNDDGSFVLLRLVHILVMRIVFRIFFPEVEEVSDEDLDFVAVKINSLWYMSKHPWLVFWARHFEFLGVSTVVHQRTELHAKLATIFHDDLAFCPTVPRTSPLNALVPAYLGLFRTTLRCFLEVRFRSDEDDRRLWIQILQQYCRAADNDTWLNSKKGVAAQEIIAETLRLYPPTARMYMQGDSGILDAVDIKALHRDPTIWGPEPLKFWPGRWREMGLDVGDEEAFIPFGRKMRLANVSGTPSISMCPSRTGGGPKLIAVLVGCFLEVFGEDWEVVAGREVDVVGRESPLRKGADAYESLKVRRVKDGP